MKQILATITVAVTLVSSSASAFDSAHLKRLKDTGYCINCDLSGANLEDAKLMGAKLEGADLKGANLTEAELSGADLTGTNFRKADMNFVNMKGAILCNTTMPDKSVIYSGC